MSYAWVVFNGDEQVQCIITREDILFSSVEMSYKGKEKIILARRYLDYLEWTQMDGTRVLFAKRVLLHVKTTKL